MLERASVWRPIVAAGVVSALVSLGLAVVLLASLLLVALFGYGLSRALDMRRNNVERVAHGVEHACIAMLQKFGHHPTEGRTKDNTFVVGLQETDRATDAAVWHAAQDAIRRIRNGHRELAYTPQCGTSLMVRLLLTSLAMVGGTVALLVNGFALATMIGVVGGYVVARVAARPLGLLIQHTMTVSTQFSTARVVAVKRIESEKNKILYRVDLEVIA